MSAQASLMLTRLATESQSAICGEVEDVVGALTPDGRGAAQVFHDLLVELRLLLVAEVEEGKRKKDRRKAWK